ncbi:kinase [Lactiplantibacillus daowaiensis]|uniref:Kinase n=1 Tax=Lactiplantibacillus daowaiensis TaxID=2559918 RepID=A0ABW1RYS9_9LACO|nr:kinase [Lactiplantibacillus daowaiensis]
MATKLIILRGNADSNKAVLAHKLQDKLGPASMVISQDVVRQQMLHVHDYPGNQAIELIKQLADFGNHQVEVVIVEGCLVSQRYRAMIVTLMKRFEQAVVYRFEDCCQACEQPSKLAWLPWRHTTYPHEQALADGLTLDEQMKRVLTDLQLA